MSAPRTRGISVVCKVRVSEPNRKETVLTKVQFRARCNAAIPPSHKQFQDQFLSENYVAPKLPPVQKKGGKGNAPKPKLQNNKNKYI